MSPSFDSVWKSIFRCCRRRLKNLTCPLTSQQLHGRFVAIKTIRQFSHGVLETHSYCQQYVTNAFSIDNNSNNHFFDSLLWCHWANVGEACYLSSLRSSNWVSKTQKNGVIGCQKLGQFLTVSLPVKTNVFPWLWSIHIRRGKIDGTTPLKTESAIFSLCSSPTCRRRQLGLFRIACRHKLPLVYKKRVDSLFECF